MITKELEHGCKSCIIDDQGNCTTATVSSVNKREMCNLLLRAVLEKRIIQTALASSNTVEREKSDCSAQKGEREVALFVGWLFISKQHNFQPKNFSTIFQLEFFNKKKRTPPEMMKLMELKVRHTWEGA